MHKNKVRKIRLKMNSISKLIAQTYILNNSNMFVIKISTLLLKFSKGILIFVLKIHREKLYSIRLYINHVFVVTLLSTLFLTISLQMLDFTKIADTSSMNSSHTDLNKQSFSCNYIE